MSETTTNEISYRPYRDGDEAAIVEFFNLVFQRNQKVDEWRWAYRQNPIHRMDVELAISSGNLVGQSAGIPLQFKHHGLVIEGTRVQNVMVHPEYRNRGIFLNTLRNLTEAVDRKGLDFILTFPNDNSLPAFIRKLDYGYLFDLFTYWASAEKIASATTNLVPDPNTRIEVSDAIRFENRDVGLIDRCLAPYEISVHRTPEYLNWRFSADSGKKYLILRRFREKTQTALVVFKLYRDDSSVDLVEFFSVDSHEKTILAILKEISAHLKESAVTSFNVWSAEHYRDHAAFREAGFEKSSLSTHVVYRVFSDRCSKKCGEVESYYIAMGDSDVY